MNNKKTWIAMSVLIVLLITAITCLLLFKPETVSGMKEIVVQVTHKDGSINTYEFTTDAKYLYDALAEQGMIGELIDGYFTEVDGENADTDCQEWWGYTKSGEYVNYGVSECTIENGDHYEFTFNIGW